MNTTITAYLAGLDLRNDIRALMIETNEGKEFRQIEEAAPYDIEAEMEKLLEEAGA
ncbi:hypothetical protein [Methylobacterium sp. ID0610]|uniref:hypothetical protein n=1 Tax=Methylobacterium carpenticola TaxID=3344827 RepID=UPI0036C9E7DE